MAVLGHWYASCLTDDTRHCFLNELLKLFETEVEVREVSEGAKANLDRLQEFALLLIFNVRSFKLPAFEKRQVC